MPRAGGSKKFSWAWEPDAWSVVLFSWFFSSEANHAVAVTSVTGAYLYPRVTARSPPTSASWIRTDRSASGYLLPLAQLNSTT